MNAGAASSQPSSPLAGKVVLALAVLALFGTTALVLYYAGQPPLDRHAFRQTQTAITAYWFIRDGYRLAYETPVAGYPWILPFEFPLYQAVVAALSELSGLSVSLIGRLVSYAFLLLIIPVAASITRRLGLSITVLAIFVALTFTSPVYVYWGRAILIETCALFFGLLAIKFALDYLLGGRSTWRLAPFSLFLTLCLLQKVTTGLPILLVFAVLLAAGEARHTNRFEEPWLSRWIALVAAIFVPLLAAFAWTSFADAVKLASPLGPALTSSALSAWNWGTLSQRISSALWGDVIVNRIFFLNLGGIIGPGLIFAALMMKSEWRIKAIILTSVALGLVPLFLFSNLHIVHDYYQSSNVIFLIYGLAVALGAVVAPSTGGRTGLMFLVALMIANGLALVHSGCLAAMRQTFGADDRNVAVGRVLVRELGDDEQFVAFGNDYSATFAYLSGRKSFTVPPWFKDIAQVIARPGDFVEKGHLGAVVACSDKPNALALLDWVETQDDWKLGETSGCAIAVPANPPPSAPHPGECRGVIEQASVVARDGRTVIALSGWSATDGAVESAPEAIFVELRGANGSYIKDTLRIPRPDINLALGVNEELDLGFSRLLPGDFPSGAYRLAIIQRIGGEVIACAPTLSLNIP